MNYLSPVDAAFLRMESSRTPMHVGGLLTFRLPDDAPPDYLHRLIEHMRSEPFMPPPFTSRLARGTFHSMAPAWEETETDIDYHVRHSALPYPGGERELGVLVARLHSHPMDLSRPLWEVHLIEGLENNRFALYLKAHHCAVDGMAAMRIVRGWLTEDPADRLGMVRPRAKSSGKTELLPVAKPARISLASLRQPVEVAGNQVRSLKELANTLLKMSAKGQEGGVRAALSTPRSQFNRPITAQRRLGTQILELDRIKAITAATGTTVNDVSLAICGGAIRRYLLEMGALPKRSLLASVPIGLPRSDGKPGNAVAGFVCPMGTDRPDPVSRLESITRVTSQAKDQLRGMSPTALEQFTMLGLSPLILGQMAGVLAKMPPFFNVVVSNVVASKEPLYLFGAELEAMFPMSILFDGYALNITLVGYVDRVAVGFTGCRNAIPSLQKLAVYTGESLVEMEKAFGLAKPSRKATVAKAAPRAVKKKSAPKAVAKKTAAKKKTAPAKKAAAKKLSSAAKKGKPARSR
jgi:diacylglycerol O-acyltransferase